jgi:serine/threonine protein kinase
MTSGLATQRTETEFFREIFSQLYCTYQAVKSLLGWNVQIDTEPIFYAISRYCPMKVLDVGRPFRPAQKKIILSGIARALCYVHSCGVMHQNIRPTSIFLDDVEYPRLGNFTSAKYFENELQSTQR